MGRAGVQLSKHSSNAKNVEWRNGDGSDRFCSDKALATTSVHRAEQADEKTPTKQTTVCSPGLYLRLSRGSERTTGSGRRRHRELFESESLRLPNGHRYRNQEKPWRLLPQTR